MCGDLPAEAQLTTVDHDDRLIHEISAVAGQHFNSPARPPSMKIASDHDTD